MRLILALLLAVSGCVAAVRAGPLEPVYCLEQVAPHPSCEADYIWLPGYWGWDGWGRRVWIPGRYTPRYPYVRDHRR